MKRGKLTELMYLNVSFEKNLSISVTAGGNGDGKAARSGGCAGTDIQHIIIGLVRQHLLCQHSSHAPPGGKPPAELRILQNESARL